MDSQVFLNRIRLSKHIRYVTAMSRYRIYWILFS